MLNTFKKRNNSLVISIIFLLLLSFGYDDIYASASGEAKKVTNGVLTIEKVADEGGNEIVTEEGTQVKVTYRYDRVVGYTEEIIRGYDINEVVKQNGTLDTSVFEKSIYLSQEIVQALLGKNKQKLN